MRIALRVFAGTAMVLALIIALGCVAEIFDAEQNVAAYARLYGFTADAPHWQFKSLANFRWWRIAQMVVALLILHSGWVWLNSGRLRWLFYPVTLVVAAWYVRYYWLMVQSNFDHYPGFDPYLL